VLARHHVAGSAIIDLPWGKQEQLEIYEVYR
jgi:hypothetical protein